jgi:hypothetical protein
VRSAPARLASPSSSSSSPTSSPPPPPPAWGNRSVIAPCCLLSDVSI